MADIREAARNWGRVWRAAWEALDVEAVVALYAPNAEYWTEPFREPYRGLGGAREYVTQAFGAEHTVTAWFGEPVVDGQRAVVPWYATQIENEAPVTLAGMSFLWFDDDGLVVQEWDTWNSAEGLRPRPPGWARG
jgi:hypothetical protein